MSLPTTQREWRIEKFGGPQSLKLGDGPVPVIGDTEVLVKRASASGGSVTDSHPSLPTPHSRPPAR